MCRSSPELRRGQIIRIIIAFAFTTILITNPVNAQQFNYISADYLIGHVVNNYPNFPEVPNHAQFVRVRINKHLNGYKNWHRFYRFPYFGVNIVHGNLGNNQVLGNVTGVMADMIMHQHCVKHFALEEGMSLGAAYYNKKYDEVTNPTNIVVGSHFTILASASLNLTYRINNKFEPYISLTVFHGSNSHLALPNVGVNVNTIGAGVRYNIHPPNKDLKVIRDSVYNRKIHFNIRIGLGLNEQGSSVAAVNGPKYPIYIGSLFITKKFGYINKVQFGLEGYYNTGVYDFITAHKTYTDHEKQKSSALIMILGHEFLLAHFSLLAQGGIYLYNPFYKDEYTLFYNGDTKAKIKTIITAKIGMQYYLKDATKHDHNQLYIGCYIKTNFGQAEFFETGLGYQF